MNLALVVTAAGRALRFGSDKLLYPCRGIPLGERSLALYESAEFSDRVIVLNSSMSPLLPISEKYGFRQVINSAPEKGLSLSVMLAVQAVLRRDNPDGILFATADMPFTEPSTVDELIGLFNENPDCIIAPVTEGGTVYAKPVIFPKSLFPELLSLSGDTGGKAVMNRHTDIIKTVEISEKEAVDIDTVAKARQWLEP